MGFESLAVQNWRQFANVEITFHNQLTVITGANATGKSTLIGILARHFNWSRSYAASPVRRKNARGAWETLSKKKAREAFSDMTQWDSLGSLKYSDGDFSSILAPSIYSQSLSHYDIALPNQRPMAGIFISSHRSFAQAYSSVQVLPAVFTSIDDLLEQFVSELRNRWNGTFSSKTPQLVLKEMLLSAALFSASGDGVERNEIAFEIWHGFQSVLSKLFPTSLGFKRLRVRTPDIIIESKSGDFILDDASGGLSAIIEIAWQIFLYSLHGGPFTVLLDEPENHLHPSLQREVMPQLLATFPQCQFIVASHSPFVVTSAADSYVYALDNVGSGVEARQLDYANKAATADETLIRVLGLESTLPRWAAERLDDLERRFINKPFEDTTVDMLRIELERLGVLDRFPLLLAEMARNQRYGQQ